jgi:hypothetical protein
MMTMPIRAVDERVLPFAPVLADGHWGGRAFRCRVESREAPRRLRLRYPGEFIVGTGEWRLDAAPGGTRVTYELDVVATGRLAVLLGWLLPLGKIHSKFMREVLESLERETGRRVGSKFVALN